MNAQNEAETSVNFPVDAVQTAQKDASSESSWLNVSKSHTLTIIEATFSGSLVDSSSNSDTIENMIGTESEHESTSKNSDIRSETNENMSNHDILDISYSDSDTSMDFSDSSSENNTIISLVGTDISIESEPESTSKSSEIQTETNEHQDHISKRKQIIYTMVSSYNTFAEGHKHVCAERFKKHETKKAATGKKTFYRCGHVKQRSKKQCDARRMIFEDNPKAEFEYHVSNTYHTCDKMEEKEKINHISQEMKAMIVSCAENRMTPKYIVAHINKMRDELKMSEDKKTPTMRQIHYIVSTHKAKKTSKIVELGQLIEWAEANTSVPEDFDTPFVIDFGHSDENAELKFQFVVSTRRMIDHCASHKIICVDATYKVNWMGFPFIVVGAIDKSKKFHPLCLALSTHGTTIDYTFVFESLVKTVQKLHTDCKFEPKVVIFDAVDAIKNAVEIVFLTAEQIMCYVH